MEGGRSNRSGMLGGFDAIADWTNSLNGNGELDVSIAKLATLIKADCSVLIRKSFHEEKPRIIARHDIGSGKFLNRPAKSHADLVLGDNMRGAKVASLWKLSENQGLESGSPFGRSDLSKAGSGLAEVVVLTLQVNSNRADFLEFHFLKPPLQHNLDLLVMLAETLANTWKQRLPSIISRKFKRTHLKSISGESCSGEISILDIDNPAKLSRSEYRICALLKEGMTVSKIAQTLPICEATVRSHLSSIFSKTDTINQVELLHMLNRAAYAKAPALPPRNDGLSDAV